MRSSPTSSPSADGRWTPGPSGDAAAVGDPAAIAAVARRVSGVRDCHALRARGMAGFVRVDLHITVDPALPVVEAHAAAEAVTGAVRAEVGGAAEVLVHLGAATLHGAPADPHAKAAC